MNLGVEKASVFPSGLKPTKVTIEVPIVETNPEHKVKIGSGLGKELSEKLIHFLMKHKKSFAWTTEDMPGIDPKIISYELHMDPSFKPIKQKRRKLGRDRTKTVNDEVERP